MNRIKRTVLGTIIFMLGVLAVSCVEDSTSFSSGELPDIVIDTTGMSTLSVLQFEELEVSPTLQLSGITESDLSFEWRLYPNDHDTSSVLISKERDIEGYIVELTPTSSNDGYLLKYTVTDETTGLEYIMPWSLQVLNSLGEGLLIAETANQESTDLSLIMAAEITPDYDGYHITRNIYSTINGNTISGSVNDMVQVSILGEDSFFAITDQSIIRIDRLDFSFIGENEELFYYYPSGNYDSKLLGHVNQNGGYTVYGSSAGLYGTNLAAGIKFDSPLDSDIDVPHIAAFNKQPSANTVINFYDEGNGQFVFVPTFFPAFGTNNFTPVPTVSDGIFDPANVPNKESIDADASVNGDTRHLLKDKETGDYSLYVLNGDATPLPQNLYDFTGAPEIEDAEFFVLPDNQQVMYYATKTKIYAVVYSAASPVFQERYQLPAGEEITTLELYHQKKYPTADSYISTDGKQLVMSTYNGSEGKVYLLPITNLGVGNIDESNVTVFHGFNRITNITPIE